MQYVDFRLAAEDFRRDVSIDPFPDEPNASCPGLDFASRIIRAPNSRQVRVGL